MKRTYTDLTAWQTELSGNRNKITFTPPNGRNQGEYIEAMERDLVEVEP